MRLEYGAGSAAPEEITTVLDSTHNRHMSHARDGAGSGVSSDRLTSLLASIGLPAEKAVWLGLFGCPKTELQRCSDEAVALLLRCGNASDSYAQRRACAAVDPSPSRPPRYPKTPSDAIFFFTPL